MSWSRFFSSRSSVGDRVGAVEDGGQYELMIEALAEAPRTHALRAHVDSVRFTSDQRATVRCTLLSQGRVVGPVSPGTSVRRDGVWVISFKTVCSLTT